jgi:ABC-type multidrug transport system fused ATPase/permease subunit
MKGEYTILIIAHRLSTVIGSDRILLIDEGKVIDEGKHEDLIKNNEYYKNLYNKELI